MFLRLGEGINILREDWFFRLGEGRVRLGEPEERKMGHYAPPRRGCCSPRRGCCLLWGACDCLRHVFMACLGVGLVARFVIIYGLLRGPLCDLIERVIT